MRVTIMAAACLIVAGCAGEKVETAEAPPPPEPKLTRADCYTVVLFDDPPVIPAAAGVPAEHARYLGSWTRGAWDGKWCHELYVTEVRPDGSVELYEMHAPFEAWGQPASAFKRTARIDENGDLRFRYGTETVKYELGEGRLYAQRSGRFGDLEAVLVPPGAELPSAGATVEAAPAGASAEAAAVERVSEAG